jgi:cytochrome P450
MRHNSLQVGYKLIAAPLATCFSPGVIDTEDQVEVAAEAFKQGINSLVAEVTELNNVLSPKTISVLMDLGEAFVNDLLDYAQITIRRSNPSAKTGISDNQKVLSRVLTSVLLTAYLEGVEAEEVSQSQQAEWAGRLASVKEKFNGSYDSIVRLIPIILYPTLVDVLDTTNFKNSTLRIILQQNLPTKETPNTLSIPSPQRILGEETQPLVAQEGYAKTIMGVSAVLAAVAFGYLSTNDHAYLGGAIALAILGLGYKAAEYANHGGRTLTLGNFKIDLEPRDVVLGGALMREMLARNLDERQGGDKYNAQVEMLAKCAGLVPPDIYRMKNNEGTVFFLVTNLKYALEILRDHGSDLSHGTLLPRLHKVMKQNLNGQEGADSPDRKMKRNELMALSHSILPFQFEALQQAQQVAFSTLRLGEPVNLGEFTEHLTRLEAMSILMGFEQPEELLRPHEEFMKGFTTWFWENPKSESADEARLKSKDLENMGHEFLLMRQEQIRREFQTDKADQTKLGLSNSWLYRLGKYFANKCNVHPSQKEKFIQELFLAYERLPVASLDNGVSYRKDELFDALKQVIAAYGQSDSKEKLSDSQVNDLLDIFRDIIKEWASMTVLGHETTAILYARLIKSFIDNPEYTDKMLQEYEEGLSLVHEGQHPELSSTDVYNQQFFKITPSNTRTYLSRAVTETLYNRSPVTQLAICVKKPFTVGGRSVPVGAEIVMPVTILQEQSVAKNIGKHPSEWSPDFWQGKSVSDSTFLTFGYLGKSTEPRACPGRYTGMSAAAQLALITIKYLREKNLTIEFKTDGQGKVYPFNRPSGTMTLVKAE